MEKWFLFSNNKVDNINNLTKTTSKVSLDRLKLKKENGGLSLRRIKEVFSASKAKLIMKSTLKENENKYCYILLREKLDKEYEKLPKNNFFHPIASNKKQLRKKNICEWYKQANLTYSKIEKQTHYTPKPGEEIFNLKTNKIQKINNNNNFINKGIVPLITNNNNEKNTKKKIDWNNKNININYTDYKRGKINLKRIFYLSEDKKQQPKWSKHQQKWIDHKVNLKRIFTRPLKTITKIDNFRRKFFLNFWYRIKTFNCSLCGNVLSTEHILNECSKVKEWFEEEYSFDTKIAQLDPGNEKHLYS